MDSEQTVLLIEDDPADARLVRHMLVDSPVNAQACRLLWVQDLDAGIERLRAGDIDIVLLDLGLPGSTSIETVQRLLRSAPSVPTLIVLSGLSDEDVAVQALSAGAQDYLIKGQVDAAILARSMRYARGRTQADNALREAGRQVEAACLRAERANQAKSRFLAAMSHDLRTPLAGIMGLAQLMLSDPGLAQGPRHTIDTILHSGEHMLALVNDILDLAKIESGKFELCPQEFELRGSLQLVMDIIGVRAQAKSALTVRLQVAEAVPAKAWADERRLRQVLLNLLDNAVKFTQSGEVVLCVEPAGAQVRFAVMDGGPPLAPAHVAQLFQPFEQLGDAQRRSQGTGLGLSICRQLVRQMGGDIEVKSAPGAGNSFSFHIDCEPRRASAAHEMTLELAM